jgi:hypothetical protein
MHRISGRRTLRRITASSAKANGVERVEMTIVRSTPKQGRWAEMSGDERI